MTNNPNVTSHSHVSYSAITTWMDCGERYRLTRIVGIPEVPAWWSIGGSAVHAATETIDRAANPELVDLETLFADAFTRQTAEDQDERISQFGIRSSKGQAEDWWRNEGPAMVKRWVDWRTNNGWKIWTLPNSDFAPAVEFGIQQPIGGVMTKAFIDRVMITPAGDLVIVDLKTGQRKPASDMQLGIYALLIEKQYGIRINKGAYWMARTGELTDVLDLSKYTEERIAVYTQALDKARQQNLYVPNVSWMCGGCGVSYACWAVKNAA